MRTTDTGASGCPCAAAVPSDTSGVHPASSPTAEEGLGTRKGAPVGGRLMANGDHTYLTVGTPA